MQFSWYGKDGMIIGDGQLFLPSFFQPCLSLGFMAARTAAVFAGMIGVAQMIAVGALEEMASHSLGTAVDNILHCPPVTRRHSVAILVAVLRTVGPHNIRYPRHVTNRP
jgi:hypothetical protein